MRFRRAAAFGAILLCAEGRARAEPQASAGVLLAASGVGEGSRIWSSTHFAAGVRADVLFLRERDVDGGLGPYVEVVTTRGFSDVSIGAGGTFLLPVHPYLPLVLSAGPFLIKGPPAPAWELGAAAQVFWGSRSYNYHGAYGMAAGLVVESRYEFGPAAGLTLLVGARLDLELVALPFLLALEAIRHP